MPAPCLPPRCAYCESFPSGLLADRGTRPNSTQSRKPMQVGAIIGVVVGSVTTIIASVAGFLILRRRLRKRAHSSSHPNKNLGDSILIEETIDPFLSRPTYNYDSTSKYWKYIADTSIAPPTPPTQATLYSSSEPRTRVDGRSRAHTRQGQAAEVNGMTDLTRLVSSLDIWLSRHRRATQPPGYER